MKPDRRQGWDAVGAVKAALDYGRPSAMDQTVQLARTAL
jgi:hypothetical protein